MKQILVVIYAVIFTLATYPIRIYNKHTYGESKKCYDNNYKLLHIMTKKILKIMKIKVNIEENRKNNTNKAVLFVGNHRSNFDSLILITSIDSPLIFIGKKEIKKFPIIGKWFVDIGCIFIDREDTKSAINSIMEGVKKIKEGYSLVIFPEGSRTKEKIVKEFKPGSLKLAQKTKANIVPITFVNTEECYEIHKKLKSASVHLDIGKEIDIEEKNLKTTTEIATYVSDLIKIKYAKIEKSI